MNMSAESAFPPIDHDHRRCVDLLMSTVERLCAEQTLRLTPQRRRVLEILAASHVALGAYDILARLGDGDSRPAAPISVYRALDFLLQHGLVHRVESLNAFVACTRPGERHDALLMICSVCRRVAELQDAAIATAIAESAAAGQFLVTHPIVEIAGICRVCRTAGR